MSSLWYCKNIFEQISLSKRTAIKKKERTNLELIGMWFGAISNSRNVLNRKNKKNIKVEGTLKQEIDEKGRRNYEDSACGQYLLLFGRWEAKHTQEIA